MHAITESWQHSTFLDVVTIDPYKSVGKKSNWN